MWSAVGALTAVGFVLIACAKGADDEPLPGLSTDDGGATTGDDDSERIPGADDDDDTTTSSSGSSGTTKKDGGGDGGGSSSGNVTSACATALSKATWDFESGAQGWTHAPSDGTDEAQWPFDPWDVGTDSNDFPCPNGSCFGAELSENYAQCSRGDLLSPKVDLSACAGQAIKLQFAQAYDFQTENYNGGNYFDGGIVELSSDGGNTWSVPSGSYPGTVTILPAQNASCVSTPFHVTGKQGFVGTQQVAATFVVAVPNAMLTNALRIRFSTGAGVSTDAVDHARGGTAAGWRIDDVKFVGP